MKSSLLTLLVSILGSAEPCYGLMEVSSRLRYGVWSVWREYLSDHLVPPRACDSAHGLTGKERAISRLVAPGSRVTSEPDPTTVSRSAPFIRSKPCVCRRVRGWDLEFESGLLQRRVHCEPHMAADFDPGHLSRRATGHSTQGALVAS